MQGPSAPQLTLTVKVRVTGDPGEAAKFLGITLSKTEFNLKSLVSDPFFLSSAGNLCNYTRKFTFPR